MLRRVELVDGIPEELKALAPPEKNPMILLGTQVFEMSPMTLEDYKGVESIFADTMKVLSSSQEQTVDRAISILVEQGILTKILQTQHGIEQDTLSKITLAQLLHAASVWLELNFFSVPEDRLRNILDLFGYFASMLFSMRGSSEDSSEETTITPANEEIETAAQNLSTAVPTES